MNDLEQLRDDQLRPWLARATVLIWDRLADARAHAEAGRWPEADQRFTELRQRLLDDQSGTGSLLSNARAAFYRQAFHHEPFDGRIHADGIRPEPAGELTARFAAIGGRNQYVEARKVLDGVKESLRHLAAVRDSDDNRAVEPWPERFDGWLRRQRDAVTEHIQGALSDAQISLSEAVFRIRIKPELR